MIAQHGYEIDSQGNIGNETKRIEDLQLRFILLEYTILSTIKDGTQLRMAEQAVKACHKESGIPISELASLLVRMTQELKEISNYLEKKTEDMQDFFRKN